MNHNTQIQIDIDLDYIFTCPGAMACIAEENNISVEELSTIFRDAITKGITSINKLNDCIERENQNDESNRI